MQNYKFYFELQLSESKNFHIVGIGDCIYLVGDFIGGQLDIVHEGLLGFMTADVHHLDNGVFVGEIHISDAAPPGSVGGDAAVTGHYHFSFGVALYRQFPKLLILLLLHRQFGGNLDGQ